MTSALTSITAIDDRPALDALLREYCEVMLRKLVLAGGMRGDADAFMADVWATIDTYLPPAGRIFLAHDAQDQLVGCGFLSRINPDTGELKRLFVRPEMRRSGLGRSLMLARIDAAREMGLSHLQVDTIKGNVEMLRLYESLGFRYIDRYPGNSNPPELGQYLVYLQYDL
jgi:GNAT superfamily N-acetyltransferase